MSEVRGEQWQAGLHVGTVAVPRNETVDGKCVTKVMKTRLPAGGGAAQNTGVLPQANKYPLQ